MNRDYPLFKNLFFSSVCPNLLLFDKILNIFSKCTIITINGNWSKISSLFISLFSSSLQKINKRDSLKIQLKWFKFDDSTNYSSCTKLLSSLNEWDIKILQNEYYVDIICTHLK